MSPISCLDDEDSASRAIETLSRENEKERKAPSLEWLCSRFKMPEELAKKVLGLE